MTVQIKLVAEARDLDHARRIVGVLEEALEPPPLAVTAFEATHPAHRVEAYFDSVALPDLDTIAARLADVGLTPLLRLEPVPDANWVAISQAALPPVEAGRFVVHGRHDAARVGRRHGGLRIDAGEAFGTAHHATTHGCLLALDRLSRRPGAPGRVLDLGCGSGVLALAAARVFPHAAIRASDVDPVATQVARANAVSNGLAGRVEIVTAVGLAHPRLRGPFDLVLANILAEPLVTLAPFLRRVVAPAGRIVLSGLLATQVATVIAAYRAQGFRVEQHRVHTGWGVVQMQAVAG
jgi:ribosomal protein L11 methyltransferase